MSPNCVNSLPPEVWQQCVQLVKKDDLRSLSLACQLLRHHSLPLLLKRLDFHIPQPSSWQKYHKHSAEKFSRIRQRFSTLSNSELCGHVRNLSFAGVIRASFAGQLDDSSSLLSEEEKTQVTSEVYQQLLQTISENLHSFTRLRKLDLSSVEFPGRFFQAVADLPHLETIFAFDIYFSFPTLNPLMRPRSFATFNHQSLEDVAASDLSPTTISHCISPKRLENATMCGYESQYFLASFVQQDILCSNLTQLVISVQPIRIALFFEFLTLCPVLKKISVENISSLEQIISVKIPVPATAAPQLSSYQGPPFLAVALTPSRPVTSITILGQIFNPTPGMLGLLSSLSSGSAPVTKLDLDSCVISQEAFTEITCLFPNLEYLTLNPQESVRGVANELSYLAILEQLNRKELPLPKTLLSLRLVQEHRLEIRDAKIVIMGSEVYTSPMQLALLRQLSIDYPKLRNSSLGKRPID